MTKRNFDAEGFYKALAAAVAARKVTWKEVSAATGVSATTLSRMAIGRKPDAASIAALSAWAGLNPADYCPDVPPPPPPTVDERLAALESRVAELEQQARRNAPATQAAWMHVPIGGDRG